MYNGSCLPQPGLVPFHLENRLWGLNIWPVQDPIIEIVYFQTDPSRHLKIIHELRRTSSCGMIFPGKKTYLYSELPTDLPTHSQPLNECEYKSQSNLTLGPILKTKVYAIGSRETSGT